MSDSFGPFNRATAITPSDTVNIVDPTGAPLPDAIYVGGGGIVAAVFQDGTVVNFTAVVGEFLTIKVKRVNATNTTATLLNALFMV